MVEICKSANLQICKLASEGISPAASAGSPPCSDKSSNVQERPADVETAFTVAETGIGQGDETSGL
jgi:hypothetical protein